MKQGWTRWIFAVVFWLLFAGSIALDAKYPLLRIAWYVGGMALLAMLSVFSVVNLIRHRDQAGGYASYRGVPLWFRRLIGADEPQRFFSKESDPD